MLAIVLKLTMKEPVRGHSEDARADSTAKPPPFMAVIRLLMARPGFVHLAIGAAITVTVGVSIAVFMAPFLIRVFHLPLARVGLMSGLINGLASGIGIVVGGFVPDWIGRGRSSWHAFVPALFMFAAGPLFVCSFLVGTPAMAVFLMFLATACLYTYFAPTFALMHNMVEPRMRATAAAFLYLIINLIGMGLGPPLVGVLSDTLAHHAFAGDFATACAGALAKTVAGCKAASATGLRDALAVFSVLLIWASLHFAMAGVRVKRAVL